MIIMLKHAYFLRIHSDYRSYILCKGGSVQLYNVSDVDETGFLTIG